MLHIYVTLTLGKLQMKTKEISFSNNKTIQCLDMVNINQVRLNKNKQLLKRLAAIVVISCITPCIAIAADVSAATADAKHSIENAVDNQTLEYKVNQVLKNQVPEGSFTVVSYGQKILLAGQVPSDSDKAKAETAAVNTAGVKKVWNYLTVGANEDTKAITSDAYLTSAAKTRLLAQKGVNSNNIKVVTSNKVVYLLGQKAGKSSQVKAAIVGIKGIDGVQDVVSLIGQ